MENFDQNITIAYKYLNDELNPKEKDIFNERIEKDADFKLLFNDIKKIWDFSENIVDEKILNINIDKEWQKLQEKTIQKSNIKKINTKSSNKILVWGFSIAASIILLVGLFFISQKSTKKIIAENEIIRAQLPDNSEIVLNRNSQIEYSKNFEKNRIVKLNGNAYFKVKHNENNHFIVAAGDYNIEVVGTEFYVNSDTNNFEVDVVKGRVKVFKNQQTTDTIILSAGERTILSMKNLYKLEIDNNNFLAWQTHKIVINNLTLRQIANILSIAYGVDIQISSPELEKLTMTATFENQSIQSIFSVIEATLNIKIIRQNDKYIIIR